MLTLLDFKNKKLNKKFDIFNGNDLEKLLSYCRIVAHRYNSLYKAYGEYFQIYPYDLYITYINN